MGTAELLIGDNDPGEEGKRGRDSGEEVEDDTRAS